MMPDVSERILAWCYRSCHLVVGIQKLESDSIYIETDSAYFTVLVRVLRKIPRPLSLNENDEMVVNEIRAIIRLYLNTCISLNTPWEQGQHYINIYN